MPDNLLPWPERLVKPSYYNVFLKTNTETYFFFVFLTTESSYFVFRCPSNKRRNTRTVLSPHLSTIVKKCVQQQKQTKDIMLFRLLKASDPYHRYIISMKVEWGNEMLVMCELMLLKWIFASYKMFRKGIEILIICFNYLKKLFMFVSFTTVLCLVFYQHKP